MDLTLMYDSTCPAAIPDNAELVAPYADGIYRWSQAQFGRFVGKRLFITVEGDPSCPVFDLEPGCCTVAEVAKGIHVRRELAQPSIVYCSLDAVLPYIDQLRDAGLVQPPEYWWVAQYELAPGQPLNQAPPAPTTLPAISKRYEAVAHQYFAGPNVNGYDLSVINLAAIRSLFV